MVPALGSLLKCIGLVLNRLLDEKVQDFRADYLMRSLRALSRRLSLSTSLSFDDYEVVSVMRFLADTTSRIDDAW